VSGFGRDMYFPGTEDLASDEMRVVSCGTGMPAARRSQAATCWLVQLGNGDNFVFDIGSGSLANLASLAIPYDGLDRLFLSHLHQDHVGDLVALWIGGWPGGRHGALRVWGPSGPTPELGTRHLVESMKSTYGWDYHSRLGVIPSRGGDLEVEEFDYRQENEVVYAENGVTIRSWPAIHSIDGPVSYSLEWNGLKFVFGGDTEPNSWYTEYAKGADLAIHECFMSPYLMMEKYGFGPRAALNVAIGVHTVPAAFGAVMDKVRPRMAVAYHFFNDFDLRYSIFEGIRRTYDGPLTMATDLLAWNVTKDEIRVREVIVDECGWPTPSPTPPDDPNPADKMPFSDYIAGGKLDLSDVLDPLVAQFKRDTGIE
jgi:ribonuclease Z